MEGQIHLANCRLLTPALEDEKTHNNSIYILTHCNQWLCYKGKRGGLSGEHCYPHKHTVVLESDLNLDFKKMKLYFGNWYLNLTTKIAFMHSYLWSPDTWSIFISSFMSYRIGGKEVKEVFQIPYEGGCAAFPSYLVGFCSWIKKKWEK